MRVEVTDLSQECLSGWEYDGIERNIFKSNDDVIQLIRRYSNSGPAWMLMVGGEIVGVGGFYSIGYNGVAQMWMYLNKKAYRYRKSLLREAKAIFRQAKDTYRRVQTSCLDCTPARNFLEHLGFEPEGTLRKITEDGRDMIIYAVIKEDE